MGKRSKRSNITVAVRVRPLINKELRTNDGSCIKTDDNLIVVFDPMDKKFNKDGRRMHNVLHRSRQQKYRFDHVFTQDSINTIFQLTAMDLIEDVLKGYNACIFAYGATGSGKTYTMLGKHGSKGLTERSLEHIFDVMDEESTEYSFQILASYVEIYNENIRDLLNYSKGDYLDLRDDPNKGLVIAGVQKTEVQSIDELMRLLRVGNGRRTTESTKANAESSRSHAVLQVTVHKKPRGGGFRYSEVVGKLSLIDLAGSERGTVTENRGIRLREGAKINRSLLALANCINALGDKSKKGTFVPYRDSKLTRLLKDSLGGNSKTLMMCNISPANSQFEETLNTLKYASRAKKIKTRPKENKRIVELHIAEYKNIIKDLKEEIQDLRHRGLQASYMASIYNNICEICQLPRRVTSNKAKQMMNKLSSLFQEQLNMRKTICEIEAQNKMNRLEIMKDRELARTGKGLVTELRIEIANLENSTDFNSTLQNDIKGKLVKKVNETEFLLTKIEAEMSSEDSSRILEELVKNKMIEVENLQMEANLKMYEEYNMMLMLKIKQMHKVLRDRGINFDDSDDQEEAELNQGEEPTLAHDEDEIYNLDSQGDENQVYFDKLKEDIEQDEQASYVDRTMTMNYSKTVQGGSTIHNQSELEKTPERVVRGKDGGNEDFGKEDTPYFNKNQKGREIEESEISKAQDPLRDDGKGETSLDENALILEEENYQGNSEIIEENELNEEDFDGGPSGYEDLDFKKRTKEEEIRELEEMGFDMGEYQGTLKQIDKSELGFGDGDGFSQGGGFPQEKHFTMTQADITREMEKLDRISKMDVNKSKIQDFDRSSTVRLEKGKTSKVDWNLVVNWGEEWKLYDGEIYPETILTLEGDLSVGMKDFEECLTKDELGLLRKIELGENVAQGGDKDQDDFGRLSSDGNGISENKKPPSLDSDDF